MNVNRAVESVSWIVVRNPADGVLKNRGTAQIFFGQSLTGRASED